MIEVFNDINDELINFYLVCQRHPEELLRLWELTPRSISLFKGRHQGELATDIERAVEFLSQNTFGFNGKRDTFSKARGRKRNTSLVGKIDKLSALAERFDKVTILNQDVFSLLDFYDSETTFFFLDPPYLTGDQSLYGSHSEFDHRRLSKSLQAIKGKYLLTIDDSLIAKELYFQHGVNSRAIQQKSSLSPTGRQMNQLAIYNYQSLSSP